jgi:hypothetical protein
MSDPEFERVILGLVGGVQAAIAFAKRGAVVTWIDLAGVQGGGS